MARLRPISPVAPAMNTRIAATASDPQRGAHRGSRCLKKLAQRSDQTWGSRYQERFGTACHREDLDDRPRRLGHSSAGSDIPWAEGCLENAVNPTRVQRAEVQCRRATAADVADVGKHMRQDGGLMQAVLQVGKQPRRQQSTVETCCF